MIYAIFLNKKIRAEIIILALIFSGTLDSIQTYELRIQNQDGILFLKLTPHLFLPAKETRGR